MAFKTTPQNWSLDKPKAEGKSDKSRGVTTPASRVHSGDGRTTTQPGGTGRVHDAKKRRGKNGY